jgi:feruloyl esterase
MVPGMSHCNAVNGVGPTHDDFRWLLPQLERWVEKGIVPEEVVTTAKTSSVSTRTRLICPYPEVSKYRGAPFDSDKAESFTCVYPDYPIPHNDWDDVDRFPWDTSF